MKSLDWGGFSIHNKDGIAILKQSVRKKGFRNQLDDIDLLSVTLRSTTEYGKCVCIYFILLSFFFFSFIN